MAEPAIRYATYEDLLALGEERHHEILAGILEPKAAPQPGHGRAQRALGRFVGGPFDDDGSEGGGGWWILTEVEVALSTITIVRPDLVGYRRERLPRPEGAPLRVVPDWVCEILSPSSENRDRVVKAQLYAEAGVPHYWIVSPEARTVEAYELEPPGERPARRWIRAGAWEDGDAARIPPFDSIELEVGRWFLPRPPEEPAATE